MSVFSLSDYRSHLIENGIVTVDGDSITFNQTYEIEGVQIKNKCKKFSIWLGCTSIDPYNNDQKHFIDVEFYYKPKDESGALTDATYIQVDVHKCSNDFDRGLELKDAPVLLDVTFRQGYTLTHFNIEYEDTNATTHIKSNKVEDITKVQLQSATINLGDSLSVKYAPSGAEVIDIIKSVIVNDEDRPTENDKDDEKVKNLKFGGVALGKGFKQDEFGITDIDISQLDLGPQITKYYDHTPTADEQATDIANGIVWFVGPADLDS